MTASSQINVGEVYKMMGRLEEAVANVQEDLKDIKESQEDGKQARETMGHQLAALVGRMNQMDGKIASASEITEEVRQWKQRGIGGLFVVGIGSSALTAAILKGWGAVIAAVAGGKLGG